MTSLHIAWHYFPKPVISLPMFLRSTTNVSTSSF